MSKDHFVPRHYLRQFSNDISTELLTVSQVCPYRYIGTKGIGGQCQQDDFEEGDKRLSELLKVTENDLAPVLKRVSENERFTEPELVALRWFTATLHVRTRKAAEAYKEFPKHIFYEVIKSAIDAGKLPLPPEGKWTKDMVGCKGVPGFLMNNVIPCSLEMQTLAAKLLKAPDGSYFITSDHPVIVLNQFCADAETLRSHVGFSKSGFQLLLPVSPKLCLIFYDAKIYKIGSSRHKLIDISSEDVGIVNSLQIQSAENYVYFHSPALESEVQRLSNLYAPLRKSVQDGLEIIPTNDPDEKLLHFRQLTVALPKTWMFCKNRKHIKFQIGDRRDPAWTALIGELTDDFQKQPNGGDIPARIEKILADPNSLKNLRPN